MSSEPASSHPNSSDPTQDQDSIPGPDKLMMAMFLLGLTLFGLILLLDLLSGLFR
jgi:hypothetical protein